MLLTTQTFAGRPSTDIKSRLVQEGVAETGVSVAFTVRAMDAGPVLAQARVRINTDVQAPELLRDLFQRGTRCGALGTHPTPAPAPGAHSEAAIFACAVQSKKPKCMSNAQTGN